MRKSQEELLEINLGKLLKRNPPRISKDNFGTTSARNSSSNCERTSEGNPGCNSLRKLGMNSTRNSRRNSGMDFSRWLGSNSSKNPGRVSEKKIVGQTLKEISENMSKIWKKNPGWSSEKNPKEIPAWTPGVISRRTFGANPGNH